MTPPSFSDIYATVRNNLNEQKVQNFAILKLAVLDNAQINNYENRVQEHNNNFFLTNLRIRVLTYLCQAMLSLISSLKLNLLI